MFSLNCVFGNDIFLLFLRIYDVIKIITMTCIPKYGIIMLSCKTYE